MVIIWRAFKNHCCANSTSDLLNENLGLWGPEADIFTRSLVWEPFLPEFFYTVEVPSLNPLNISLFSCGFMPTHLKATLQIGSLGDFQPWVLPPTCLPPACCPIEAPVLPWRVFMFTCLFSAESAFFPLSVGWFTHGESSESDISS